MGFRGLFIGIDRYRDARIPWLSGAARDGRALHALFSDAVGGSLALLSDETATAQAIRRELSNLSTSAVDEDVVVITYAGHGTEDHRLVPYDADASALDGSCISLEEIAEHLTTIRGATLLCVLDCCFSGGLGARVFSPPLRARAFSNGVNLSVLDRFVGEGRVVLTASAIDEEALESPRHGHGLLTYRLLEALQGVPSVRVGDQISLYKLVEYVTEQVQADATRMGYTQTPALRGRLEGTPTWPVLVPGVLFEQLFPERARAAATSDPSSLAGFLVPAAAIEAWRSSIPGLNQLQLDAINEFRLLDGENLVVTAPTSSGKTMIGELAALKAFADRRRSVFLLPMRALVNDKYQQFNRIYGPMGVRTVRATGEHSDDVPGLLGGQFDIALLTYEKYSALALGFPHLLDLTSVVVIDEAQILTDRTRGANLEFLLTLLNRRREQMGSPQIVTLSAVVGDLGGLDTWIGGRNLHSSVRPVDLIEGVLHPSGHLRTLDKAGQVVDSSDFVQPLFADGNRRLVIPLLRRLVTEGKKVIVFRQSKGEAIGSAIYLSQALGMARCDDALAALPTGDQSTSSTALRQALAAGVAFHTTDLNRDERAVIEEVFRDPDSPLRVVTATPTLAMGVNTPASAVVIVGLTHPGVPPTPYSVAEYKNMVGRAGRLGHAESGESYLVPEGGLDFNRAWSHYVHGTLEDLRSQLVPDGDPRSLMLRVLASIPGGGTGVMTEEDVVGFLESSFAAFQARREPSRLQWTSAGLTEGFGKLVAAQLITPEGNGYRLTALGRFAGESGVHVDSIVRLVDGLRPVARQLNSIGLITAAQLTNELDEVYIGFNTKAKNTELPRWPRMLLQLGVPDQLLRYLNVSARDQKSVTRRAKRAAAAAMWIDAHQTDAIEGELTRYMPQRGGMSGVLRTIAERTRDLLPAVGAVLNELAPDQEIETLIDRTMLRLELGISADLVELASCPNVELTRPQLLRLRAAGLSSPQAIRKSTESQVTLMIGAGPGRRLLEALTASADVEPPLVVSTPTE